MPFANAFTITRADKAQMGKYLSYYGMSFSLAFIFAPVIGMQIADKFGYNSLWIFMTLTGFMATLGFFFLFRAINRKEKQAL
jgi:MFS family permease